MDLETRENLIYGIKNRSREGPSYEAFLDLSGMGNSCYQRESHRS